MDPLQIIGEEVSILNSPISHIPKGLTVHDTLKAVQLGSSTYYSGPSYTLPIRDLDGNVNNQVMFSHSIVSSPRPPHRLIDRIEHSYVPVSVLGFDVYRTSNNVVFFESSDGANLPHYEESDARIMAWKRAVEYPNALSTGPMKEFKGMVIAAHDTVTDTHPKDTQLSKRKTDYIFDGPNNEFGANYTRAWTSRWIDAQLKETRENELFAEFLESKGFNKPSDVRGYAVGFLPERAIAGVKDGVLYLNKNFSRMNAEFAAHYGVPEDIHLTYSLGPHEMGHRRGVPGRIAANERMLEELIEEFAEELAENEAEGKSQNTVNHSTSGRRAGYRSIAQIARKRALEAEANYGKSASSEENAEQTLDDEVEEAESLESVLDEDYDNYAQENEAEEMTGDYEAASPEETYEEREGQADSEEAAE
jgi:hypothetical protein